MSNIISVTKATFEEEVLNSDLPVLVDFWATWCNPCRLVGAALEELAVEVSDLVKIVKVDADSNPDLTRKYEVKSIPTLILFKNGEPVKVLTGAKPKPGILHEFSEFFK